MYFFFYDFSFMLVFKLVFKWCWGLMEENENLKIAVSF